MNKRERLERTFSGEATDRTPVALWRHWQGDDHRAADLAYAIAGFQQTYDWDYTVVAPGNHYLVTGYGLQDRWNGNLTGRREVIRTPIERSVDWTTLRPLDPSQGEVGKAVQTLQLLKEPLTVSDTPCLLQVYSPLTQALQLAGKESLLRHMRTQPDRVRTGLNTLTESTIRLLDLLKRTTGIAGIVYTIETASFDLLSENEYVNFGLPFDQKLLETIPASWWFTMIHMQGNAPMIHLFANVPIQVLSWQDQQTVPSLDRAEIRFSGALAGGLGEEIHLLHGTPSMIREAGRKMMHVLPRRYILTTGGPIPMVTPISHIRAVRELVTSSSGNKDG
jgi:uroporphyrinogen decarboxylase